MLSCAGLWALSSAVGLNSEAGKHTHDGVVEMLWIMTFIQCKKAHDFPVVKGKEIEKECICTEPP